MSLRPRPVAVTLLAILVLASVPMAESQGKKVEFQAVRFSDTLFAAVDAVYRVQFDDEGDLWYSTQAGVVHIDLASNARTLFTKQDGLPSSYSLGLAVRGDKVYVATDLGLGIIDRATGAVETKTPLNSPLPDHVVQEVVVDGDKLWIGTYFEGVAVWDLSDDSWAMKNTSTNSQYAKPVRRIVPDAEGVWVATEGNGAWRYTRATGAVDDPMAWRVTLRVDGLASDTVLSVAPRGDEVFFGTDRGLSRWTPSTDAWKRYTTADGLPHERVLDLDVIVTSTGTHDVFAATREGLWQLEVETGKSVVRAQSFGILGDFVFDTNKHPVHGWAFATQRGVSLLRGNEWTYFTTGPSEGASPGPVSFIFTSASVGESDFIWFGSGSGVSAYYPEGNQGRGAWFNLGEWQYYPGSTVNHIDTDQGVTWLATNKGVFGFNAETGEWIPKLARAPSRNLVYGLDADRGDLWIALFGDGLLHQNLTTGVSRSWDATTRVSLPDVYLTDVRIQGDDVWLGAGSGVMRLNRISGNLMGTYTAADGIPGGGVVFRVLPDATHVYLAMKEGGVARLNVALGKVDRVWDPTTHAGFPGGEVRSLHREGGRLWAGTTEGLARIDLSTGNVKGYNQSNSALVQNYVNGITSRDGILYLATLSGVARLDIGADAFLPMQEGRGLAGAGGDGSLTLSPPVVRIDTPKDGRAVTGVVTVTGTATRFGGAIDRVEVRVGDGEWQTAEGTATWSYVWDTTPLAKEEGYTLTARAVAGDNVSRLAQILVTVVEVPTTPLTIDHTPVAETSAGKALPIRVVATGDDPLTASVYYKRPGSDAYTRLALERQGALFTGVIPSKDVREGELTYYVEARSGQLIVTSPEDAARPHRVPVGPPPRVAVAVDAPDRLVAKAGASVTFELNVTNTGSEAATFRLSASGLRASWLDLDAAPLALAPGETKPIRATIAVPAAAFDDETAITFEVIDAQGEAEPASARVPLSVQGGTAAPDTAGEKPKQRGLFNIPGPAAPLLAFALLGAALVLRRRDA